MGALGTLGDGPLGTLGDGPGDGLPLPLQLLHLWIFKQRGFLHELQRGLQLPPPVGPAGRGPGFGLGFPGFGLGISGSGSKPPPPPPPQVFFMQGSC